MSDKNTRRPDLWDKGIKYFSNIEKVSGLPEEDRKKLKQVTDKYPFLANNYYLSLIDWDNADDPLRRLVIPDTAELYDWGQLDACNEQSNTVVEGVQHKYASTVLLLVNENCAGYCRFCFRKRLFLPDNREARYNITAALEYIAQHKEVNNVLITGGDPLMLSTVRLERIISRISQIRHVRIIRIGSKMPAYNPFRILKDPGLLRKLRKFSTPTRRIYLMCHFDHPNELTDYSREAILRFQRAGVICVNQTPIMKGISDNPETMSRLWNELSYIGVPQYYIFQGRPTAGNSPYTIPIVEAYFKIEEAKRFCSGLAKRVRYVMSHESGKIEICGVDDHYIYLKYHRARYVRDENRFFICHRDDRANWLDQLKPVKNIEKKYYDEYLTSSLRMNSPDIRGIAAEEYFDGINRSN